MTRTDVKTQSEGTVEYGRSTAGDRFVPGLPAPIRRALTSGTAAGLGGGLVLFSGYEPFDAATGVAPSCASPSADSCLPP